MITIVLIIQSIETMPNIKIYNSITRKKEDFLPLDPQNVRMYVCGPTVYDRAHLGNARPVVVFDTLFRLLIEEYGEDSVTYVRNFTDIDDKINLRAKSLGIKISEITDQTIDWFMEDMGHLNSLVPSVMPRATQFVDKMIQMIDGLIKTKNAYFNEGHVLFRVRSYEHYGSLSGRSLDDMIAGARVEVAPFKEDPLDFVLWKPSTDDLPGWESPWGRGRPGWHIECSAMAKDLLGGSFDIHCGGSDLKFPHHENEIAQSNCAHPNESFATYWMHNEMLKVNGKKMSKSLSNFYTVNDLLQCNISGEVIRFILLNTHYRKPLDWTENRVNDAKNILKKWRSQTLNVSPGVVDRRVIEALSDDLNTVAAIGVLHKISNQRDYSTLLASARFIGLLAETSINEEENEFDQKILDKVLVILSDKRLTALEDKNYEEVDIYKNRIIKTGIDVQISKDTIKLVPNSSFDRVALRGLVDE